MNQSASYFEVTLMRNIRLVPQHNPDVALRIARYAEYEAADVSQAQSGPARFKLVKGGHG